MKRQLCTLLFCTFPLLYACSSATQILTDTAQKVTSALSDDSQQESSESESSYPADYVCSCQNVLNGKKQQRIDYVYDEQMRVIQAVTYDLSDGQEIMRRLENTAYIGNDTQDEYIHIFLFDENGEYSSAYAYQNSYNELGQIIQSLKFDDGDQLSESKTYTYQMINDVSMLIREDGTSSSGYSTKKIYTLSTDGSHPMMAESSGTSPIANTRRTYYSYDEEGRLIEERQQEYWNSIGDYLDDEKTSYVYDESGNLIRSLIYQADWLEGQSLEDETDWQLYETFDYSYDGNGHVLSETDNKLYKLTKVITDSVYVSPDEARTELITNLYRS